MAAPSWTYLLTRLLLRPTSLALLKVWLCWSTSPAVWQNDRATVQCVDLNQQGGRLQFDSNLVGPSSGWPPYMKEAFHSMHEGSFYKTLHDFSVHLHWLPNLQLEMRSTFPKDTNWWAHLERILSWMLHHCRHLLVWIAEKNPASAPDDRWWVMAAAVQPLLELVNVTLVILQSPNLILSQQKNEIENLSIHLMLSMDIEVMDRFSISFFLLRQNKIWRFQNHQCNIDKLK